MNRIRFDLTQLLLITVLLAVSAALVRNIWSQGDSLGVAQLTWSADGKSLANVGISTVDVWHLDSPNSPRHVCIKQPGREYLRAFHPWSAPAMFRFTADSRLAAFLPASGSGNGGDRYVTWESDQYGEWIRREIPLNTQSSDCIFPERGAFAATLATGSPLVTLWDLQSANPWKTIRWQQDKAETLMPGTLQLSRSGHRLIAAVTKGSMPALMRVWNTESDQVVSELPIGHGLQLAKLSSDGTKVAYLATGAQPNIEVINVTSKQIQQQIPLAEWGVSELQWCEDNRHIFVKYWQGRIEVIDTENAKRRSTIRPAAKGFMGFSFVPMVTSPDGQSLATAVGREITIWSLDGRTVRVLNRQFRVGLMILFSCAYIAWGVAWGCYSRRTQQQRSLLESTVRESPRPLAGWLRGALYPWRILGAIMAVFVTMAAILSSLVVDSLSLAWDVDRWLAYPLLIGGITAALWSFVIAAALGGGRLMRWIYGPHTRSIRRATKAVGKPSILRRFESVTICGFGDEGLVAEIEADISIARDRYQALAGELPSGMAPLLILRFPTRSAYETYFHGRMPLGGLYYVPGSPQIVVCDEMALDQLCDPRRLVRTLLAHFFFHQHKGMMPPAWFGVGLGWLLGTADAETELHQVHRRLRAALGPGDELFVPPWLIKNRELCRDLTHPAEPRTARKVALYVNRSISFVNFLLETGSGENGHWRRWLNEWKGHYRLADSGLGKGFFREHSPEQVMQQWKSWMEGRCAGHYSQVAPIVEAHVMRSILPRIGDPSVPLATRAGLVRNMAAAGLPVGMEGLIGLLDTPGSPLAADAHWALQSISGERLGFEANAWRNWFRTFSASTESCTEAIGRLPDDSAMTPPIAPAVPALAPSSVRATLAQLPSAVAMDVPIPAGLHRCWPILGLSGAIAIAWSVVLIFWLSPLNMSLWAAYGVLAGVMSLSVATGKNVRQIGKATSMQLWCLTNLNLVSFLLGAIVKWQLCQRSVREYVSQKS